MLAHIVKHEIKLSFSTHEGKCFCVAPPHELTEEEKLQILHSEEFVTFFDHSSRIMERALSEQVDVFFDYSGRDLRDKEG